MLVDYPSEEPVLWEPRLSISRPYLSLNLNIAAIHSMEIENPPQNPSSRPLLL